MTEGGRRLCRFMSVAALLAAALSAQSLAAGAPRSDANTVRRVELSHWKCTPGSTESCSVKVRTIAVAAPYALVEWVTVHSDRCECLICWECAGRSASKEVGR